MTFIFAIELPGVSARNKDLYRSFERSLLEFVDAVKLKESFRKEKIKLTSHFVVRILKKKYKLHHRLNHPTHSKCSYFDLPWLNRHFFCGLSTFCDLSEFHEKPAFFIFQYFYAEKKENGELDFVFSLNWFLSIISLFVAFFSKLKKIL